MSLFGFIGVGNMGGAVARAVLRSVGPESVVVSSRTEEKAQSFAQEYHCSWGTNEELARKCDYLFLGVKPHILPGVLESLRSILSARKSSCTLISMVAGTAAEKIRNLSGGCPVIRIMPNMPVAIGAGLVPWCTDGTVSAEAEQEITEALAPAGIIDRTEERLLDAASSVAGCGPAFAAQFLEALADGGVACGLPRAKAYTYAAQMLLGSAQMILESGMHPGVLKDQVCSPGGSTIQGVRVMEEGGLRGTVMDAVLAAYRKHKELG